LAVTATIEKLGTDASAKDVMDLIKKTGVQFVDVKFVDLIGTWQHFSIPVGKFDEDMFTDGIGFDGSSIRGFQKIHESDMLLFPEASTAIVDPACKIPTLSIICNVVDPITHEPYTRDPRYVAKKAEQYLQASGIATLAYFGPEVEFYIFDDIRFGQGPNHGFYSIDSNEGIWNTGKNGGSPNLGYRPRVKEGYFPVPPTDSQQDLRSAMVQRLIEAGIDVEVHHHEVGGAGQAEIDFRFNTLLSTADNVLLYKYVIANVAKEHGKVVTFMPKPIFQENGSGMHVHQSLWKEGKNLFYDTKGYANLSETARFYIGGLLKHAPALLAFAAPTTNSYRRLVPGYEAPINLMYSRRNRSACVRIPVYGTSEKAVRLELRMPDPMANPYLAFSAMLMAGLDGIRNRIEPPAPMDLDLYELEGEEKAKIKQTPGSLGEVLNALEADHDFLLEGGVFTSDLIANYIDWKRTNEVDAVALRPHPYEFHLYHNG
jgi:glutamine synthetase